MESMQELLALPQREQVNHMVELSETNSDADLAEKWGVSLNRVRAYRKSLGIRKGSGGRQARLETPTVSPAAVVKAPQGNGHTPNMVVGVEGTATGREILQFLETLKPFLQHAAGTVEYSVHISSER